MHVNTNVVKALMHLRGIDEAQLGNLANLPLHDLQAWLYDIGENSESRVPLESQLEILTLLGVRGESLRGDVVHYWRIHEPLFSRAQTNYWALSIVLKAFGKAQAVFLARESDPAFMTRAKAHFGLRFADFMVVLEVTAHPLRSISFDPETMPDLSWTPDTFGVLLPDVEYDMLQPGAMKTRGLNQYLTYTAEMQQWERLREAAMQQGLRAEQVAALLLGGSTQPSLEHQSSDAEAQAVLRPQDLAAPGVMTPPASSVAAAPAQPAQSPQPVQPAAAAPQGPVSVAQASAPDADDDMRLFVTPVRAATRAPAQPVPLKRVS